MREIIPFCQMYDLNPPDFIQQAIKEGAVRPSCGTGPDSLPLEPEEEAKLKEMSDAYYRENWSKIILKFLRFANPHVAQGQAVSRLSLEYDPNQPVYFHAAWLKPGRNTYVIELDRFDSIDETGGEPTGET